LCIVYGWIFGLACVRAGDVKTLQFEKMGR